MPIDHPDILAQNVLEDCAVTYDATEDALYKAAYVANRSRLSKFLGENITPQNIVFDYGAAVAVDTFVFDKNFTITGGSSQVLFQWSDNNADWTTLVTMTKAGDLASSLLPIWKVFDSVSHQYYRLRMTGLTAAPLIFNVWAGTRIQLDTSPFGNFDPWGALSEDVSQRSPAGVSQVVHRYLRRTFRAQFENLTDAQMLQLDSWWSQAGSAGLPWWFMWKPASYAGDTTTYAPVYLSSPGARRDFPFYRTVRSGVIEAEEV